MELDGIVIMGIILILIAVANSARNRGFKWPWAGTRFKR